MIVAGDQSVRHTILQRLSFEPTERPSVRCAQASHCWVLPEVCQDQQPSQLSGSGWGRVAPRRTQPSVLGSCTVTKSGHRIIFALIGARPELCLCSGPGDAARCGQWCMHAGGLRQVCRSLKPSQHVTERHTGPEPTRQHLFAQHCAQCRSNTALHLADLDHRLSIHAKPLADRQGLAGRKDLCAAQKITEHRAGVTRSRRPCIKGSLCQRGEDRTAAFNGRLIATNDERELTCAGVRRRPERRCIDQINAALVCQSLRQSGCRGTDQTRPCR